MVPGGEPAATAIASHPHVIRHNQCRADQRTCSTYGVQVAPSDIDFVFGMVGCRCACAGPFAARSCDLAMRISPRLPSANQIDTFATWTSRLPEAVSDECCVLEFGGKCREMV
jgi:hypothetical protein